MLSRYPPNSQNPCTKRDLGQFEQIPLSGPSCGRPAPPDPPSLRAGRLLYPVHERLLGVDLHLLIDVHDVRARRAVGYDQRLGYVAGIAAARQQHKHLRFARRQPIARRHAGAGVGEKGLCARLHIGLLPHPLHIVRPQAPQTHDVQSREQEQREERQ